MENYIATQILILQENIIFFNMYNNNKKDQNKGDKVDSVEKN